MVSGDSRHAASIMPRPGRYNNRIPRAGSHRSPGPLQRIRNAQNLRQTGPPQTNMLGPLNIVRASGVTQRWVSSAA